MTREEAIKHLRNDWFMSLGGQLCVDEDKKDAFLEAVGMGIKALRPVSREQLKKVPRCEHCKDGKSFDGQMVIMGNKGMFPLNFCPRCGSPLTDEAVEMVMERLRVLTNDN